MGRGDALTCAKNRNTDSKNRNSYNAAILDVANVSLHYLQGLRMNIEDEIHERNCSIKFDYLDDKEAQAIAKLINKASSAPTWSKARWYLSWADSLVYNARMKVDEFS